MSLGVEVSYALRRRLRQKFYRLSPLKTKVGGLRVRSRLSIDALRGLKHRRRSSDEDLIGEDGGSLGVSSGGGGMEEELCVRRVSLHSLLSAPGVYVSLGGGLYFLGLLFRPRLC
ncbi:hypothetical protein F2Q70_00014325 [Brassica cretica]|uniref:Transmembrane protein n=1 Tax=Brassica cretica TaxID=69181 RepID=A0A8S9KK23_BRACR|nr:hypothetical protein F2Q70_00014325 [Brassica cretica]KAF2595590.1 hypothetical protein F2Q68_00007342 [Brassica cretica]